jgi:hypothetical protein
LFQQQSVIDRFDQKHENCCINMQNNVKGTTQIYN